MQEGLRERKVRGSWPHGNGIDLAAPWGGSSAVRAAALSAHESKGASVNKSAWLTHRLLLGPCPSHIGRRILLVIHTGENTYRIIIVMREETALLSTPKTFRFFASFQYSVDNSIHRFIANQVPTTNSFAM